ncbi:MAG: hypothetical protein ACK5OS_02505 [Chryseotalea sp.]|jgi:hypothetical protein
MKVTITNTSKIVTLNGVPARCWEGETESGISVIMFVTRIMVDNRKANLSRAKEQFEKELQEVAPPSAEMQAIPLKMLI